MRSGFEGYFTPTEREFYDIWKTAHVVFDTNVLLNVYRYRQSTTDKLLDAIARLGDRAWIPHQVALEYHRNRAKIVTSQQAAYERVVAIIQQAEGQIEGQLRQFTRHRTIDVDQILGSVKTASKRVIQKVRKQQEQHPDLLREDPLRDRLVALFEGKTGAPFPKEVIEAKHKDADQRIAKKIPPGYMDADKDPEKQRGDVIAWLQTLDHASTAKVPILMVTDDSKEDWWHRHDGKALGPRPELIAEMREVAGVPFYLYSSHEFLQHAGTHLGLGSTEEAAQEIENYHREIRYPAVPPPPPMNLGLTGLLHGYEAGKLETRRAGQEALTRALVEAFVAGRKDATPQPWPARTRSGLLEELARILRQPVGTGVEQPSDLFSSAPAESEVGESDDGESAESESPPSG